MKILTISVFIVVPLLAMDGPSAKVVSKTEEKTPAQIHPNQQEFAKLVIAYIRHGEIGQIEKLGKIGVNFNVLDHDGQGPIHFATKICSATAFSALLRNKANINFPDQAGCRPLHYFCRLDSSGNGRDALKKLFEEFKAKNGIRKQCELDPNAQDNQGQTPLHEACILGNLDTVRFLRSLKAKLNIRDNNKQYAIELTENREIIKSLILVGARVPDSVIERPQQDIAKFTLDHQAELIRGRFEFSKNIQDCRDFKENLDRWIKARKTKNDTLRKAKTKLSPRSSTVSSSSVAKLQQLFESLESEKEG